MLKELNRQEMEMDNEDTYYRVVIETAEGVTVWVGDAVRVDELVDECKWGVDDVSQYDIEARNNGETR